MALPYTCYTAPCYGLSFLLSLLGVSLTVCRAGMPAAA